MSKVKGNFCTKFKTVTNKQMKNLIMDYKKNPTELKFNKIYREFKPTFSSLIYGKTKTFEMKNMEKANMGYDDFNSFASEALWEHLNKLCFIVDKFIFKNYEDFETYCLTKYCRLNKIGFELVDEMSEEKIAKIVDKTKLDTDLLNYTTLQISNRIKNKLTNLNNTKSNDKFFETHYKKESYSNSNFDPKCTIKDVLFKSGLTQYIRESEEKEEPNIFDELIDYKLNITGRTYRILTYIINNFEKKEIIKHLNISDKVYELELNKVKNIINF